MTSPETRRHQGAVAATLAGIVDRWRGGGDVDVALPASVRLDGRTALVTGGTRGLGRAVAEGLARRGAHVLLTGRSDVAATAAALAAATGARVEGLSVDLTEPAEVRRLADDLRERPPLDVAVLNAGIVPVRARRTSAGLDVMTHLHLVANAQLVDRLVRDGTLADRGARIVVVGSESHRSAEVDPTRWLEPQDYGTSEVVAAYGRSKLLLHLWAAEAAARYAPRVAVHHLCPGAIASDIAREAPPAVRPLLGLVFRAFFQPPDVAARPVLWLAASPDLDGATGRYLHMTRPRDPAPAVTDAALRRRLWDDVHALLDRLET